jgi:hypothetical protein
MVQDFRELRVTGDHCERFLFSITQCFLTPVILDIDRGSKPSNRCSRSVAERLTSKQKPVEGTVRSPQTDSATTRFTAAPERIPLFYQSEQVFGMNGLLPSRAVGVLDR